MEKYKWLNKHSRLFLKRGYLEENQEPEERIKQIAENAEKILGIKGFAKKFEGYMSSGFFSLATPVWTNFGNKKGLPVSCVSEDSWINTKFGGKQAKDIKLGDEVLTHKGRYRKVIDIIPTPNKDDIYILKVETRSAPIKITGNHQIKTNLGWVKIEELDLNKHLIAVNGDLENQVYNNGDYCLQIDKFIKNSNDGLFYCPIISLLKTDLIENVYDFTIEEDHSFCVLGIVVHNCFNSHISDATESIFDKVGEIGMMSKFGGGTSGFFGDLRPRGSAISGGGKTEGPVRFMELFDKTSDIISQGSSRRGSFAAYLPVEHPDIEEFLMIRSSGHPIQNMSIGVTITDAWMNEMIGGDSKKRDIWAKIIQKRYETGYPYISFIDNINNNAPQVYKDKNLKIKSQNLCVSGNERVVSNYGLKTARELFEIGKDLILFDNQKTVKASKMELIEKNADTYKINLNNGMSHTVTSYHQINIFDKFTNDKNGYIIHTKDVKCSDLKIGDKVSIQTNEGIFGDFDMQKEAFLLGLYQGDGTQYEDFIMLDVWENDFDLIPIIQEYHDYVSNKYNTQHASNNKIYKNSKFLNCSPSQNGVKKKRLCSKALKKCLNFEKGYVPKWIWESNKKTQWEYIKGLYYTDGTVGVYSGKGNAIQLSLASIDKKWLGEIQLILSNLGMQSSIRLLRKSGISMLPDGKGGKKSYLTKEAWRLIISNKNDCLKFDENTGFLKRKKINIEKRQYRDNTKKFYKIKSIEYVGKQDVFCCKVDSKNHHWICNGFITHNCNEICLSSDEKNSFVCVLSSLNLLHWDEIVKTDAIETLIYFLDAVNEEFVIKSKDKRFLETAHNFAKTQRALGMGVLGWHSFLQSKMVAFESLEAKMLNSQIWKIIREDRKSVV